MTLGIIDHKDFYTNGKEYRTSYGYNKIAESLAVYFDKVILYTPVYKNKFINSYEKLNASNIEICELPSYKNEFELLLKIPIIFKILLLNVKKCDIFQVRIPSHIGVLGFFITKLFNKPIFIYVAGDWAKVIRAKYKYGFKKYICSLYATYAEIIIKLIVKQSLSFVTGQYLLNKYKQYKNVYLYISSSLSSKEIIQRDDTCQNEEIRILSIGRLVLEKGTKYLLEAIKYLKDKNLKIKLDIVGQGICLEELQKKVESLNIKKEVNFLGYLTHNSNFLSIFDKADIFVLPSIGGEGTPKVVLEAMARGVPVIATNDGGIPWLVINQETGILIEKGSVNAICQAIEKIIDDKDFRKKIIRNANLFVKELVLQKQAEKMIKKVLEYKNENRL